MCGCSVVFDSLQPHEPQHTRPPCPSPTARIYPNPCPLSRWCHPTITSSVIPFFSCPQSFPAPGSFQISQLFSSGGQSIGVSASTSYDPMNYITHQAPLSMEFSKQEYWSDLPFPSPGDLPNPKIKPMSPTSLALAGKFSYHWATWKPQGRG